jgi:hypothetical protein
MSARLVDLVLLADGSELVRPSQRIADRQLLRAEVHRGAQRKLHAVGAGDELVHDFNGVLHVRQEHALFDDQAFDVVPPHRQAGFKTEFGQIAGAVRIMGIARTFTPSHLDAATVGQAHLLGEVAEHHHPAMRSWQRRDQ